MKTSLYLARIIVLFLLALAAITGLFLTAPTQDRASASSVKYTPRYCQVLPNYVMDVVDRPAARDGYLVVCFGDPLARGPIVDFRIER